MSCKNRSVDCTISQTRIDTPAPLYQLQERFCDPNSLSPAFVFTLFFVLNGLKFYLSINGLPSVLSENTFVKMTNKHIKILYQMVGWSYFCLLMTMKHVLKLETIYRKHSTSCRHTVASGIN